MDWLDYLYAFYQRRTGLQDEALRARIREDWSLTLPGEPPVTLSWEPLDRNRKPRGAGYYGSRLIDGRYVYYARPPYIPDDHIFTLVSCPIRRQSGKTLHMQAKKALFGSRWIMLCNSHQPVVTVERLWKCLLTHMPDRPDLLTLRLQSDGDSFFDRLIVETHALPGSGGNFCAELDWRIQDAQGRRLTSDEAAPVLLERMHDLLLEARQILD